MNFKNAWIVLCVGMAVHNAFAQRNSITYESNGLDSLQVHNPFKRFIGEWTLKNDSWTQNWGGPTETIKIRNHHTITTQVNTANSLFSIIDGPQPNGHIFWSYNPVTEVVNHLSSFGELRAGVGQGSISENADVILKIAFEGEPEDTYRIYTYTWIGPDEYHMKSIQYNANDEPTGLFYEGNFIRFPKEIVTWETQIKTILEILDDGSLPIVEQLKVYADDVVHMAPGNEALEGKDALAAYLREQRKYGAVKMKHDIVEIEALKDVVLMRGAVNGTFYPKDKTPSIAFKTKNLFVFVPVEGALKIKKVIYNASPLD